MGIKLKCQVRSLVGLICLLGCLDWGCGNVCGWGIRLAERCGRIVSEMSKLGSVDRGGAWTAVGDNMGCLVGNFFVCPRKSRNYSNTTPR